MWLAGQGTGLVVVSGFSRSQAFSACRITEPRYQLSHKCFKLGSMNVVVLVLDYIYSYLDSGLRALNLVTVNQLNLFLGVNVVFI
jgi:hypothetical protein